MSSVLYPKLTLNLLNRFRFCLYRLLNDLKDLILNIQVFLCFDLFHHIVFAIFHIVLVGLFDFSNKILVFFLFYLLSKSILIKLYCFLKGWSDFKTLVFKFNSLNVYFNLIPFRDVNIQNSIIVAP